MNKVYFATKDEAIQWMLGIVNDECVDNIRFAFTDDAEAVRNYYAQESGGCCGFFDREIVVNNKSAFIGCNYGH